MRIRRVLVPWVLAACTALTACGGGNDDSPSGTDTADPTPSSTESGVVALDVQACDLLTADQVAAAVGAPVRTGTPSAGAASTGGMFSSCTWASDDPEHPADSAIVTLYPNTDAADSARGEDAQPLEGLGGGAFSASFASIWAYVGTRSLFAQWYTFNGTDQDNLPHSRALARAAIDAL